MLGSILCFSRECDVGKARGVYQKEKKYFFVFVLEVSASRRVTGDNSAEREAEGVKRSMPSLVCSAQPCDSCCCIACLHAFVSQRHARVPAKRNVAIARSCWNCT